MLPLSKMSKTFRTSSNQLTASLKISKKETAVPGHIPVGRSITTSDDKVPKLLKHSKEGRKSGRFLSGWLSTSDAHLKKETKEGVESTKSLDEITSEIEETLDSIGASYSFSKKRDKIKAKITKGMYF